jgi:hypothetical protein
VLCAPGTCVVRVRVRGHCVTCGPVAALRPSDGSPHRAKLLDGNLDDKEKDELFLSHRLDERLRWQKHPYTWIRAKMLHTWLPNDCSRLQQFMNSLANCDLTSAFIFILMLLPVSSTIIFVMLFFFMFKEDEVRSYPVPAIEL